ncbi:GntR family transcriptional regulator [Streptomyces sp. DH37]|uniref:GntR family transcriptional regulator n=1 Tax=Streptomyces sp. DH37 TaxID=3040122 RepID=UPI002440FF43|nr:GntR family transcriptional regulator [Streptomyces sp. DH37]MDG9701644.1 GntR family transcriptional regulator [Streptomyces sp. DH37]
MVDAPHRRLAAALRQRITDGTYPPGSRFPSHRQIADEHGVGAGAAYQAVALLRREGLLDGRPGARLTVAYPPAVRTLTDPDAPWPHGTGDVERGTVQADGELRARLGLARRVAVQWERAELLDPDGRPALLLTRWWRGAVPREHAAVRCELRPHQMTAGEAAALGLAAGTAALLVERTRLDETGRPVETADLVLPADRWRVSL